MVNLYPQTNSPTIMGWSNYPINEIANLKIMTIDPQNYVSELFEHYSIPAYYEIGEPILEKGIDVKSQKLLVEKNTILFGCLNPRVPKVWYINSDTRYRKIASTEFLALMNNELTHSRYLYHLMWSDFILRRSHQLTRGSTPSRERVDKKELMKQVVILPPFKEQVRIAEILDTMDRTITQTEQLIEKLRAIKSGLLHDLLTRGIGEDGRVRNPEKQPEDFKESDGGMIAKEWNIFTLDQVIELANGESRPKDMVTENAGLQVYPVFGGNGILGYSSMYMLNDSTVVIGRVGEYCGSILMSEPRSWISDNAIYVKKILHPNISIQYLDIILRALNLNRHKLRSGQPLMTQSIILSQNIWIPSENEQDEIIRIVQISDNRIEVERKYLKKLQQIKKGLMSDLLTGQVRVKVPKEKKGGS